MINTTDRIVFLKDGGELSDIIKNSLSTTILILKERYKELPYLRPFQKTAYEDFFCVKNLKNKSFDQYFVNAAFKFNSSDSLNSGTQSSMDGMAKYTKNRTVSATGYPFLKGGIKITLVELWRQGALMLPTLFQPGPYFKYEAFDHEVINWLRSFDPKYREGRQKRLGQRLHTFGPRIVLASDWSTLEDVSITDIANLHLAQLRYITGDHPYPIAASSFPWTQLPSELLKCFPNRTSFNNNDLIKYSAWSTKQGASRGQLQSFILDKKPVRKSKKTGSSPLNIVCTEYDQWKKKDIQPLDASSVSSHDDVLTIVKRLGKRPRTADWRVQIPSYPGREHVDISLLSKIWINSFRAFLHHREHIQGYRSDKSAINSLNILADYIFLYLPWWKELYSGNSVELPRAPKYLKRYIFVSRYGNESIEILPVTLLGLIKIRRPKPESAYITIKCLNLYFRFISTHFRDDESVAGEAFISPIDDEFDTPRLTGRKNKTNKNIIPKNLYGYLLFYCYAVEKFGELLLTLALNEKNNSSCKELQEKTQFDCDSYGVSPIVHYRGKNHELGHIPNVFQWANREVLQNGRIKSIIVPHLTALRLLIVALETGLRCQSIQWLDRISFDKLNNGNGESYTYHLFVNTDKTKTEPWSTPVVFRVRNVLLREVAFQTLFTDFGTFQPVFYENSKTSPFEKIFPLFKNSTGAGPITDGRYSDTWLDIQISFEHFYKQISGEKHVRMYYLNPIKTNDGQPVIRFVGRNEQPYCAISILAVHTPHACRATFCTNRQAMGLLEVSDVAELVGHESVITTSHYTKFSSEQLRERLEHGDKVIVNDFSMFSTGEGSGYVRADKPDSALISSFVKDRTGTIKNFGFVTSTTLWNVDDDKEATRDGLRMLQEGPMSHIRFRETHVCPVGEECPSDILKQIGEPKRCGFCPLAMKCVEHLPAIAAKINQMVERISYLQALRRQMESSGEPVTTMDSIWDLLQLDINELIGWKLRKV